MAHSLNNAKAAQFKDRVGSFSTHGSRRGFVDIPLPIPEDQLNAAKEEYLVLCARVELISEKIKTMRQSMGIPHGTSLRQFAGPRALNKRPNWSEHRWGLFNEIKEQGESMKRTQDAISALRRRLSMTVDPLHQEKEVILKKSIPPFTITKTSHTRLLLFREVCRKRLDAEVFKDFMAEANAIMESIIEKEEICQ